MTREDTMAGLIRMEWEAFDKVRNKEGRASCQDDWPTFEIMRKSQYMTWPDGLLESFYVDFSQATAKGWNLIMEKYGRMMESTSPEEYAAIEKDFPKGSERKRAIVDQIAAIQVSWAEAFAEAYPKLAPNIRSIHASEDNLYNTSYETYLKGELLTYSDGTLGEYARWIISLQQQGKNLTMMTVENTMKLYGYASLEEANEK